MMQYVMKVNSLTKNNPSSSSSKNDLYECFYKIFINKSIIDLLHSVSVVLKLRACHHTKKFDESSY